MSCCTFTTISANMICKIRPHKFNPVNIPVIPSILQCLPYDLHFRIGMRYYRFAFISPPFHGRVEYNFRQNMRCHPNNFKIAITIDRIIHVMYRVIYQDIKEDISIWGPHQVQTRRVIRGRDFVTFVIDDSLTQGWYNKKFHKFTNFTNSTKVYRHCRIANEI